MAAATLSSFSHPFQRTVKYLQLQAQGVLCAIELKRVERIVSLMALNPVPSAPDYLVGVFDYHGFIVPVIDLSLRIGQTSAVTYDINSSVVLCETMSQDTLVGLIVTDVGDVIELKNSELQLLSEFSDKQSPLYACYKQASPICFLLDSDILLDSSLSDVEAMLPKEIRQIIEK
ncbi:MAG: chemotaxis protein CheW [Methylococcales bacterium]|nr:chemotaxis protein CheW [Methylococcales bacterium]